MLGENGVLGEDVALLWANGDSVEDGTARNLWHGIRVFGGVEVQPGTLSVLFQ